MAKQKKIKEYFEIIDLRGMITSREISKSDWEKPRMSLFIALPQKTHAMMDNSLHTASAEDNSLKIRFVLRDKSVNSLTYMYDGYDN